MFSQIVEWFSFIIGFLFATFVYGPIALLITGHWILAIIMIVIGLILGAGYIIFLMLSYPG